MVGKLGAPSKLLCSPASCWGKMWGAGGEGRVQISSAETRGNMGKSSHLEFREEGKKMRLLTLDSLYFL